MSLKGPNKQYPVSMTPRVADDLEKLAVDIKYKIPRHGGMRRGPMVGYLCRWFLTLSQDEQVELVRKGKKLLDADIKLGGAAVGDPGVGNPDAMPTTVVTDIVAPPKQRKAGPKKGGAK